MQEHSQPQATPIVGHHSGWGLGGGQPIRPYELTPGSIDTLAVRVREKIDVHGVGTDVVDMRGTFTVRRDDPCAVEGAGGPQWGVSCVKTEFRSLELAGESPLFGTVRVHLDPSQASHGEVGPADVGSLAAACVAHCFPVVELPELGMRLTTAGSAVDLASKVVQIPPVGDVARSENSAVLVDEGGSAIGEIVSSDIEVGQLLYSVPLGSTRPRGEAAPMHTAGNHDDPSGPCFYAEPPVGDGPAAAASSVERPSAPTSATMPSADLADVLARLETDLRQLSRAIRGARK